LLAQSLRHAPSLAISAKLLPFCLAIARLGSLITSVARLPFRIGSLAASDDACMTHGGMHDGAILTQ
jgi:hypothetical protein